MPAIPFKFVRRDHLLPAEREVRAARAAASSSPSIRRTRTNSSSYWRSWARFWRAAGPYILTDLRWNDGPLYVRYGAFARSFVVAGGTLVPAVTDARAGWSPTGAALLPGAGVGHAARVPGTASSRRATPRRSANCRTASRRRCTSPTAAACTRASTPATGEGRPQGGAAARGPRRRRGGRRRPARPGEVRPAAGVRARRRARGARLVHARRPPLPRRGLPGGPDAQFPDRSSGTRSARSGTGDDTAVAEYTSWALDMSARVEAAVAQLHDRDVVIGDLSAPTCLSATTARSC